MSSENKSVADLMATIHLPSNTPKTITRLEELSLYMVSYVDGAGEAKRIVALVRPDGSVFTIPQTALPLEGVNKWFSNGVQAALKVPADKAKI